MQFDDENIQDRSSAHGMGVLTTAVFIVGEVAGSGVLALPKALNDTGWIGVVLMVLIAGVAVYTGTLLGCCWMIVLERHASGLDHKARQPYPSIGQAAFGKHCRRLVVFCVDFTCFGGSVVFLLLASQNINELLTGLGVNYSFCFWLMVIVATLCPLTWLGTPKDFWQVGLIAALATAIGIDSDGNRCSRNASSIPWSTGTQGLLCRAWSNHIWSWWSSKFPYLSGRHEETTELWTLPVHFLFQ
ncbi:proton-coupled amino acid transporter 4 [Elysia marginata]|uniref:Proton-coupled amino acid transporter 4 n=1 Tax=Elysia marginata TaxID=1093978 RepID=A0AAV4FIP0_9GAST|nr:proton-coupled amino acid transporter 4 [Elysia marginata]